MKTVRFSKVVEKSGRPEVYLLMSETDPDFHQALEAGKIMSLSGEAHGSGTEYGTVGYDKKRHGQLLLFPKSLNSFAEAKIIGVKYDLFAKHGGDDEKTPAPTRTKDPKKSKENPSKAPALAKRVENQATRKKTTDPKPAAKKLIPFPAREKEERDDDERGQLKPFIRQAMRALEKGNSVAAYNILKRIVPGP